MNPNLKGGCDAELRCKKARDNIFEYAIRSTYIYSTTINDRTTVKSRNILVVVQTFE